MLDNSHGNSSASDHVTGIHDNSLADNYYGEEAIGNNLKVYVTKECNHHAAGIHTILDPNLVSILESSTKRSRTLLYPITSKRSGKETDDP